MAGIYDADRPDLGGNVRHGDLQTWVPKLWRFFAEFYAVGSMLDVGCGEGNVVDYFQRLGIKAHGIDGMRSNIMRGVTPIALHDLLVSAYIMPVDFVWSCEVAEHILPSKVDNFVDTLANGRVVAMTHALPGQDGHHHVNCQPREYWIDLMISRGYQLSSHSDEFVKMSEQEGHFNYFSKSGLVFLRN